MAINDGLKEAVITHEYLNIKRQEIDDLIFLFAEQKRKIQYHEKAYKFIDGSIDKKAIMCYFFEKEYKKFYEKEYGNWLNSSGEYHKFSPGFFCNKKGAWQKPLEQFYHDNPKFEEKFQQLKPVIEKFHFKIMIPKLSTAFTNVQYFLDQKIQRLDQDIYYGNLAQVKVTGALIGLLFAIVNYLVSIISNKLLEVL